MQVINALSDDLGLQVVRATRTPLSRMLSLLPTSHLHPFLLRALHPSIDSHSSLHLSAIPPSTLHIATPAIATLTQLKTLSLDGPALTAPSTPATTHPLLSILSTLPALTNLSLRNTALERSAPALAAALSALPHLASLDLSQNHLDPALHALAGALPDATALRILHLDSMLSSAAALHALATALTRMLQLEELSFGASNVGRHVGSSLCTLPQLPRDNTPFVPGPQQLQTDVVDQLEAVVLSLCTVPALRTFRLTFRMHGNDPAPNPAHRIAAAVQRLTQLQCLQLAGVGTLAGLRHNPQPLPPHADRPDSSPRPRSSMHAPPRADVTLAAFARLTALDCVDASDAADVDLHAFLRAVSHLTLLQDLQLPRAPLRRCTCDAIAATVRALPLLSRVGVHARLQASHAAPLLTLLRTLAELPSLQAIRSPVVACMADVPVDTSVTREQKLSAAARAVAAVMHAAPRKEIALSMHVPRNWQAGEAHRGGAMFRLLTPIMHLCTSVAVSERYDPLWGAVAASAEQMSKVTRLRLSMINLPQHVPRHTPQHACDAVLQRLSCLSGLRYLSVSLMSVYPRGDVAAMGHSTHALQHHLVSLQQLTELQLQVRQIDVEFVPPVLRACRGLPCLRALHVSLPIGQIIADPVEPGTQRWVSEDSSRRWDVGQLTGLHRLWVTGAQRVPLGSEFWQGIPMLTQLQSLALGMQVDMRRWRVLVGHVKAGLPMLRELCVDAWRLGPEKVGMLDDVPSRVRVHRRFDSRVVDTDLR